MANVLIPEKLWKRVERVMDSMEWISEEEASKLLGVSVKTLQNKRAAKTLPQGSWRETYGKAVYNRTKIITKNITPNQ